MHRRLLTTLVLSCALTAFLTSPAWAILGGRSANIAEAPYAIALVQHGGNASDALFCGGSLITRDIVITAAHCVRNTDPSTVDAIAGATDLRAAAGQRVQASAISINPSNNKRTDAHDDALIKLSAPITTPAASTIALPSTRPPSGRTALTVGWGITTPSSKRTSPVLRGTRLTLHSDAFCRQRYPNDFLSSVAVCASVPPKSPLATTCEGDSGGPLVTGSSTTRVLVGIVSYSYSNCATRAHPDVFAEVVADRSWLFRAINALGG